MTTPRKTKSVISSSSAASRPSTRSERYQQRQANKSTADIPDFNETNYQDTTFRRPGPRSERNAAEALADQTEI